MVGHPRPLNKRDIEMKSLILFLLLFIGSSLKAQNTLDLNYDVTYHKAFDIKLNSSQLLDNLNSFHYNIQSGYTWQKNGSKFFIFANQSGNKDDLESRSIGFNWNISKPNLISNFSIYSSYNPVYKDNIHFKLDLKTDF